MAFAKPLAKAGMFGLGGLAATGAFKDKKKDKPKPTSATLMTEGFSSSPTPSLISRPYGG